MKTLILVLFLTGCASTPIATSIELPCPEPLVIPRAEPHIKAMINALRDSDLATERDLYEFFKRRADLQAARRNRLQTICRSTHAD